MFLLSPSIDYCRFILTKTRLCTLSCINCVLQLYFMHYCNCGKLAAIPKLDISDSCSHFVGMFSLYIFFTNNLIQNGMHSCTSRDVIMSTTNHIYINGYYV